MGNLYLGLIHHPVYNKNSKIVISAITNFDIHDIARLCKTFDIKKYFIVNPSEGQKEIASTVISHWIDGYGSTYNKDRKEAVEIVKLIDTLDQSIEEIKSIEKKEPIVVATSAKADGDILTVEKLSNQLKNDNTPILLLFGTGHGMALDMMDQIDHLLEPITGLKGYNHLSVRSAVSIYLYRITVFGK